MDAPQLLVDLARSSGPSGHETAVTRTWCESVSSYASITHTKLGTAIAEVRGATPTASLALIAHIDEIGLIITHVDETGCLWFAGIGAWDWAVLTGQSVRVHSPEGDISASGVVFHKADLPAGPQNAADLFIDIGAKDRAEALSYAQPGFTATVHAPPILLQNHRLTSRALDNRVGAFVVAEVLRAAAASSSSWLTVYGIVSTQEEVTLAGAWTAAAAVMPDYAVIVDVTFATDGLGSDVNVLGEHRLGSGPVLFTGPPNHQPLAIALRSVANAASIPHTVGVHSGRSLTDSDAVQLADTGVACCNIGVPLANMHSPVEVVSLADVAHTVGLLSRLPESSQLRVLAGA
jgi:putative aminopeptidase FrvX